jgi:hypothetical protein
MQDEAVLPIYSVRKRKGQWCVCTDGNIVLNFESYDEAVAVARSAVKVISVTGPPQRPPPRLSS